MTAEVCVMNKLGVALAADSAVSIGHEKIYTSAEKMFQLSNVAPVGIMIYGGANFNTIPWETIIKSYRNQLKRKMFDTVQEYAADFFNFINADTDIIKSSLRTHDLEIIIRIHLKRIRNSILREIKCLIDKQGPIKHNDVARITNSSIRKYKIQYTNKVKIKCLNRQDKSHLISWLGKRFDDFIKRVFEQLPLTPEIRTRLEKIILDILLTTSFHIMESGIVIAGFGEKEYEPVLHEYIIEGSVNSKIRYYEKNNAHIEGENNACLMAFAQKEMVYSFMEGINPDLERQLASALSSFNSETEKTIYSVLKKNSIAITKTIRNEIKNKTNIHMQKFSKEWSTLKKYQHGLPVLQILGALPKDELAAMAESLVNLTKFRRRVTTDDESVGGPIDVAVITKGDGFVWIRRKHYFDPALNVRTLAKISREIHS